MDTPLHSPRSPPSTPGVSVTKVLTGLLAIPTNRSCADCRSALIDSSQVHASYSPKLVSGERASSPDRRVNKSAPIHQFRRNHAAFAPPNDRPYESKVHVPPLRDLPVDPAITAASQKIVGHGVFVCALCGAAHKLLAANVAITKAVMDVTSWTIEDVQWLANAGGNLRATTVLEAHVPRNMSRPTASSTIAERLTFIRAKYEALAFVLPPSGPLASRAWQNIVRQHPEWIGLWGVEDLRALSELELRQALGSDGSSMNSLLTGKTNRKTTTELPNRLVDFFCVVSPSDCLHPSTMIQDLTAAKYPEDFLLLPRVSECYPSPDSYKGDESCVFPEHISTFVFPDGCRASSTNLPPSFFTLVLTNAAGERLYGGVLKLYDDNRDSVETVSALLTRSEYPTSFWPPWVPTSTTSTPAFNRSMSFTTQPSPSNSSMSRKRMIKTRSIRDLSDTTSGSDVMFLPKCLVILSHYPFFDLWRKFLLQLYRIALTEAPLPIERFIANFVCEVPLPPPGRVQVKCGFTVKDTWIIERPPENRLPIANFSYLPLFTCLSVSNVLVVMGCLLQETRVALVSKHYALLGPVSEALLSFLFPLHWQGMYLPILPFSMLEILDAPVPYLVGLHSRYLAEIPVDRRPQGVVIVDLDRDEVHLGFLDTGDKRRKIPSWPERLVAKLKARLIEFASSAYVLPSSQKAGYVSSGSGTEIPQVDREVYAQTSANEIHFESTTRRRDVLPYTDKAYRDNELLVPISSFLSEHGHLHQREPSKLPKEKRKILPFGRPIKKSESFESSASDCSLKGTCTNLLDLSDPPGFCASEIRESFLRFFTSLFQNYRVYLDGSEFRSHDFVSSLNLTTASANFVKQMLETQMFQGLIEEHGENPNDPEVLFFDQSINAKINRSKKMALTGRKRETSFLNENRSAITEVFTPPPPSNFGLPDDGRFYHYGRFPELDHKLFGKIRPPMRWQEQNRPSVRLLGRRASLAAHMNERNVVEKATRARGLQRRVRNLEAALKALSTPFASAPLRHVASSPQMANVREKRSLSRESHCSDVTLDSQLNLSPDIVSAAEELVLNARRKQAILLAIIVKLQGVCRMYLRRNRRQELPEPELLPVGTVSDVYETMLVSAIKLQSWIRTCRARREFVSIQRAVLVVQSLRRGLAIRQTYWVLLVYIAKAQAACRGYLLRRKLSVVVAHRMSVYRKQLFMLWNRTSSPLTFRTMFWTMLRRESLARLALAELELLRLWKELNIASTFTPNIGALDDERATQLGISNTFYLRARQVDEALTIDRPQALKGRRSSNTLDILADRVLAERAQIYERLSSSSPGNAQRLNMFFSDFDIPLKDKKKKLALTESLWSRYQNADHSADLMLDIFPELLDSADFVFVQPSKKALRRFPASDPTPPPIHAAMHVQKILDERIRCSVVEIADLALRVVPSRLIVKRAALLRQDRPLERFASIHSRSGVTGTIGQSLKIRNVLFKHTRRQWSAPQKANVRASNASKVDPHVNNTGIANANGGHSQEHAFPDLLKPVRKSKRDPTVTFWVRQ